MLFFLQTSASSGSMGREASEESVIGLCPSCEKRVKDGPSLRGEPVTEAEMRVDELPAGPRLLQFLAQLADVDVHRAVRLAVGLAPDDPVQLLTAHDAVMALRQGGQKLELAHGQLEAPAVEERHELGGADLKRPDLIALTVRGGLHGPATV